VGTDPALSALSPNVTIPLLRGYVLAVACDLCFALAYATPTAQHATLWPRLQSLLQTTQQPLTINQLSIFSSGEEAKGVNYWDHNR